MISVKEVKRFMPTGKVEVLDLRPLPPFERHEKIFARFEALRPGDTLTIINDHDPKPLHYQFEAERKGEFEWRYEERGPKDWRVAIKKLK
ncbi:MAG: DUF2249 domain-containing protein [bacterium]